MGVGFAFAEVPVWNPAQHGDDLSTNGRRDPILRVKDSDLEGQWDYPFSGDEVFNDGRAAKDGEEMTKTSCDALLERMAAAMLQISIVLKGGTFCSSRR